MGVAGEAKGIVYSYGGWLACAMRKGGVGEKYRKELCGGGVEGLRGIVFPGDAFEHTPSAAASAAARHFGGWRGAG